MPSSRSSLALVCVDFALANARGSQLPALERLIALSDELTVTTVSHDREPWQSELALALRIEKVESLASAPFTWVGTGGAAETGSWMHADPVRFDMVANGLALRAVPHSSAGSLSAIENIMRQPPSASFQWRKSAQKLFLYSPTPLCARTTNPYHAVQESLYEAMPSGPDAARLKQLMTELQMALHQNSGDESTPNAVWLWGLGAMPLSLVSGAESWPYLFANDEYSRGVFIAHGVSDRIAPLPESLHAISASAKERSVVVLRGIESERLDAGWFAPALRAFNAHRFGSIEIYLNGFHAVARRSLFKRIFARSIHLDELAVNRS